MRNPWRFSFDRLTGALIIGDVGQDAEEEIIGGYVVRDTTLRALYGNYLFGDNCKPQISSVLLSAGHARENRPTGLQVSSLSAFGQDDAGHVYAVSLTGPVYRLTQR